MPTEPGEDLDLPEHRYKRAIKLIDKLFPFFHQYQEINFIKIAQTNDSFDHFDKMMVGFLKAEIEDLLINQFGYITMANPDKFYGRLSDKGKEVQAAGGHNQYILQRQKKRKGGGPSCQGGFKN